MRSAFPEGISGLNCEFFGSQEHLTMPWKGLKRVDAITHMASPI